MLSPGTVLKRGFVIERVLGEGGMGCVYLARQTTLGDRPVALKETVLASDPEQRAQLIALLQREARILAALDHPGVVKVMDFFEEGDAHFFAMEYIDGRSLQDICEAGPTPVETVLEWADQLCDILSWLHEREPPVIVRDLKPANMLLNKAGRIRIIDFGIANIQDSQGKTATVLRGAGTMGYAPVEQFSTKGGTDQRSDIYGLGGTLYTLLTCQVPPWSVDIATGDAELIPPRKLSTKISPELEAVVLKMMALKKDDRYATVAEARRALAEVKKSGQVAAPATVVAPRPSPPPPPPRASVPAQPQPAIPKTKPGPPIGLLTVAMAAVVSLIVVVPGLKRQPPPVPSSPRATPTQAASPTSKGWDPEAEVNQCLGHLQQMALELKQFNEAHSAYPERLGELRQVPVCPTTELAYDYQVQGRQFTVSCSGDHAPAGIPAYYPLATPSGVVRTEPLLAGSPETALQFALRGRARASLGQYQSAAQDFAEAVRRDPSDVYSNAEGARARLAYNDIDGAAGPAYRAVVLDPENPDHYASLIDVHLARSEPEEALKELDKLAPKVSSAAGKAELARLRCQVTYFQLDFAGARKAAARFAAEDPADAEYFRMLCALAQSDGAGVVEHANNTLQKVGYKSSLSGLLCAYVAVGHRLQGQPGDGQDFLLTALPRLRGSWSGPAAQFVGAKMASTELLNSAGDDLGRQCEARTLLGIQSALMADKRTARNHLDWVVGHGLNWKTTYPLARAWLKKL